MHISHPDLCVTLRGIALGLALVGLCLLCAPLRADISGYAIIRDDATLRVKGHTIHLYGIHIPPTNRQCLKSQSPLRCGNRAAVALEFKKGANVVHCESQAQNPDRSVTAICRVKDDDLGAYLLERGWALALPEAPFEYHALERIARHRGMGVWGIPIDNLRHSIRRAPRALGKD